MRRYTLRVQEQTVVVDVDQITPQRYQVQLSGGRLVDVELLDDEVVAIQGVSPVMAEGVESARADQAPARTPALPAPRLAIARASASVRPVTGDDATAFTAPMPGVIQSVAVAPGATVASGDVLMVLEAMKMQNELRSDRAGRVEQVLVRAGETVRHGQILVKFAP
jgi:biotin carboxyl carrier protein